jgi:DNA-binding MarR family transcriptional regulator
MTEAHKSNKSPVPPAQPPNPCNLTSILLDSLNNNQKQLFYKVIRREFNKLLPLKELDQFNSLISLYWMIESIRKRFKLIPAPFALLTLIYYATNQGRLATALKSLLPYCPPSMNFIYNSLDYLYKHNYIRRIAKGTGQYARRGKYIELTPEGIELMRSILRELREMIYKTHIIIDEPPKR